MGMSKVYYGLSGSDANETNIKLVWYYNNVLGRPEKKKIISRLRGYHGSGLMTGSLTGLPLSTTPSTCRSTGAAHRAARITGATPSPAKPSAISRRRLAAELER